MWRESSSQLRVQSKARGGETVGNSNKPTNCHFGISAVSGLSLNPLNASNPQQSLETIFRASLLAAGRRNMLACNDAQQ